MPRKEIEYITVKVDYGRHAISKKLIPMEGGNTGLNCTYMLRSQREAIVEHIILNQCTLKASSTWTVGQLAKERLLLNPS